MTHEHVTIERSLDTVTRVRRLQPFAIAAIVETGIPTVEVSTTYVVLLGDPSAALKSVQRAMNRLDKDGDSVVYRGLMPIRSKLREAVES